MKYTSASDTHFKAAVIKICLIFCCFFAIFIHPSSGYAKMLDRVVAYVNDTAITLSEFQDSYNKMKETIEQITDDEVINSMINRILLLKEAKKMRLEAENADYMIANYIDIKIKSTVIIREEVILEFYNENIKEFGSQDYLSVREEIETYLVELETNNQIKRHLEELRRNAEIVIQLRTDM